MEDVGVVGPHGRLHHLLEEVVGEGGEGGAEERSGVGLEVGLAAEELGDVDVGEARLAGDLVVALPRLLLQRQQPRHEARLRPHPFLTALLC